MIGGNRRESANYGGGYKGSGGWSWWHQGVEEFFGKYG
jgi:hypothetical protein